MLLWIFSNCFTSMEKLQRSIPASGSSNTLTLWSFASTVAISTLFFSPPERVASTSRSRYSFAQRPTLLNSLQLTGSGSSFPAARFSSLRTVIPLKEAGCWKAKPIPALARSSMLRAVISSPSSRMVPDVSLIIPIKSLAMVDFPPPFGPVITSISPSFTVKLISVTIGSVS